MFLVQAIPLIRLDNYYRSICSENKEQLIKLHNFIVWEGRSSSQNRFTPENLIDENIKEYGASTKKKWDFINWELRQAGQNIIFERDTYSERSFILFNEVEQIKNGTISLKLFLKSQTK